RTATAALQTSSGRRRTRACWRWSRAVCVGGGEGCGRTRELGGSGGGSPRQ
ncbi:hypothetical protein Tsubulata_019975, partial [Turnera subulata]